MRWSLSGVDGPGDVKYRVIFSAEATAPDGRKLSVGTVYTVMVGDEAIAQPADDEETPVSETPVVEDTLPDGDDFSFLGKGGDPVWLLDQVS